ncbi:ATP-dependent helicase, partial [Clavibacter californiensis]
LRALTSAVTARIGAAGAGRQRQAGSAQGLVDDADPIQVIEAPTRALELARLARRLREEHLLGGVPWARMVVLVRSGSLVPQVARSLATAEVPTRTAVAGRALRDDLAALALIRAVDVVLGRVPLTPDIAAELATGPLGGLDGVQLRRLRLAMRQEELAGDGRRSSDELLVEALAAPGRLETLDLAPARRLARLARTLQGARELASADGTIEELLWHLWEGSGLAKPWFEQALQTGIVADQANRDLDGVVALFTAARRFVERNPGRPASDFVEELLGAEVPEDTLSPQPLADTVLVATPSAVVGAGYEVVAVAALQEGVWPNLRLRGSLLHPQRLSAVARGLDRADVDERAEVLGDELRMLALAVSRATRVVVLSATANDEEAPSPFLRLVPPAPGLSEAEAGVEAGRAAKDAPAALRIRPDHPLSLRGLVGALRRELAVV